MRQGHINSRTQLDFVGAAFNHDALSGIGRDIHLPDMVENFTVNPLFRGSEENIPCIWSCQRRNEHISPIRDDGVSRTINAERFALDGRPVECLELLPEIFFLQDQTHEEVVAKVKGLRSGYGSPFFGLEGNEPTGSNAIDGHFRHKKWYYSDSSVTPGLPGSPFSLGDDSSSITSSREEGSPIESSGIWNSFNWGKSSIDRSPK